MVSLSLQSIVSLANKYGISTQETAERISSFFISIGCDKVYDINLARHLALIESYREFKRRRNQVDGPKLPIISSICPGWICYAEKTNGELIIPHLSRVRSPQQIMGSILKGPLTDPDGKMVRDLYHVTLMPCFDKKLEASRQDFKNEYGQEVDCVLTPAELEQILEEEGVTLMDLEPRKLDILLETGLDFDAPLTSHFGSASGGYAENILIAEASEYLKRTERDLQEHLEYSVFKNDDFIELVLTGVESAGIEPKISRRFAIVNGFRNIQTVVQRLKRNALRYDYIEIMACPSGCINGGAQCKPNYGQDRAATIQSTQRLYKEVKQINLDIGSNAVGDDLYARLKLNDAKDVDKMLYTDFHPVPKMQNLTVSW